MKGGSALKPLLLALAGGLAAFAVGAALALAFLPEWRSGEPEEPGLLVLEYRRIALQSGFDLLGNRPHLALAVRDNPLEDAYTFLGERGAGWLKSSRTALEVHAWQTVRLPGTAGAQELHVYFSLDGHPLSLSWEYLSAPLFQPDNRVRLQELARSFGAQLRAPGESFAREERGNLTAASTWELHDLAGSEPPQLVTLGSSPPQTAFAIRGHGRIGEPGVLPPDASLHRHLLSSLLVLPVVIAVCAIFLALLLRARIDLVNGSLLALIALVSMDFRWLFKYLPATPWLTAIAWLFAAPGLALAIFLTWSAGESLLRSTHPDFTTSLDTLRRGTLGPRGGRALLIGFAAGAALAGLKLALYALAVALPGISPSGASVAVPPWRADGSPVASGILLAAGITLAVALAARLLPGRWARWAPWPAALAAGYVLSPLQLLPYPAALAVSTAFAGLLIWVCRRFGLTALLVAAIVTLLLPAAFVSALHASWLPGSLAATVSIAAGLLALGFVGVSRPESAESGYLPPPPFMRRMQQERRLRHEVDLLSRMQVGLLPQEMPRVPGWEVAARSVLASEAGGDLYDFLRDDAGRLWIAAGDVAGHGYSCAVMQAMVKAGLVSLVAPEETPATVLSQLDRVLRGAGTEHSFTSLSLVRLDPATGEALLGNAGHPYPLVLAGTGSGIAGIAEIALPGLPLGQGPPRTYEDRPFQLPPASVLLLCSDGLFEAVDRNGNAYGFERAREVLKVMSHRPPLEIVDTLLNDCRRHLGAEEPPDDVTVVVVKRA
ncbi:MAG TPA: PP2C family protein-serine/threonine phosphatase [Thermoanaerobaculia bacterium]|nr:PP2C family protein-serine/threonine phosphatase [Thermoanaerobaculia bacterium]